MSCKNLRPRSIIPWLVALQGCRGSSEAVQKASDADSGTQAAMAAANVCPEAKPVSGSECAYPEAVGRSCVYERDTCFCRDVIGQDVAFWSCLSDQECVPSPPPTCAPDLLPFCAPDWSTALSWYACPSEGPRPHLQRCGPYSTIATWYVEGFDFYYYDDSGKLVGHRWHLSPQGGEEAYDCSYSSPAAQVPCAALATSCSADAGTD